MNSNHQMSLTEVSNMYIKTFGSSWDYYEDINHSLVDISLEKVDLFIKMINKYRNEIIYDDPLTVLKKYELLRNGKITNAAYIAFAKNKPLITTIELGHFSDEISIKDSISLQKDLFTEVKLVMDFIIKHINKRYVFTGEIQREEIWDYPLSAIREIIVNMIIHRDYMDHGDSCVKIYNNRIEFFNPGHFPDSITEEDLKNNKYVSDCRNKQLARLFRDTGDMEKYGTGIRRVCEKFKKHNLVSPTFRNFQHGVKVIVYNKKPPNKTNKLSNKSKNKPLNIKKLPNKTKDKIIFFLKQDNNLTRNELSDKINVSSNTIKQHLSELQEQGYLKREGSRKTGRWIVIKKQEK